MKICILKPHQNNGIWFSVGNVYDVPELRAKDLIEAGLATSEIPLTIKLKVREQHQAKLPKTAATKANAKSGQADPIGQAEKGQQADQAGGLQGDPGADLLEQNADQQTDDGTTGEQQESNNATGDDASNNDQG